jgi:hypothetical protein
LLGLLQLPAAPLKRERWRDEIWQPHKLGEREEDKYLVISTTPMNGRLPKNQSERREITSLMAASLEVCEQMRL